MASVIITFMGQSGLSMSSVIITLVGYYGIFIAPVIITFIGHQGFSMPQVIFVLITFIMVTSARATRLLSSPFSGLILVKFFRRLVFSAPITAQEPIFISRQAFCPYPLHLI